MHNQRGRIFNIQRFSVHDGPGIRTIVFLKGCFLRCRWCCNPESQSYEIQQMSADNGVKTVGEDVTAGYVLERILNDRPYYRRSGGGVTLSGGEMLFQPEFSRAILRLSKENGVNTAVESTANADFEIISSMLPYIDTFLMDIKHINGAKHKEFTGVDNARILDNAAKIAAEAKKLIIRVPVVPTFNDTENEIADIADFVNSIGGVDEINLLPYHSFGSDKYEALGRSYSMGHITSPAAEHMAELMNVVTARKLKCRIGG